MIFELFGFTEVSHFAFHTDEVSRGIRQDSSGSGDEGMHGREALARVRSGGDGPGRVRAGLGGGREELGRPSGSAARLGSQRRELGIRRQEDGPVPLRRGDAAGVRGRAAAGG